ncbi:ParB N-terminal domain-containing protein [Limnoglobus roseus]|uniref:DNA modification methylase n=1 Tax=Limnoglobus roseus TaxID=2598579 RepID=A0A5C1AH95_9BACT|nr:ParB N-terminal domain-containing protein [Limnoglobus roseus]QEL17366.1 DNA modification methylase [Limnoglobus roseus]
MSPFTLREMPLDQLVPAPYNPRRPLTATAYRKLRLSVTEFGLVEPLIWNERTGYVVGGHARLRILRELGYATVPVSVVNLTDERERALNVVLNNQEAQGRYDPAKLLDLLEGLQDVRDLTGFDEATMRTLKLLPMEEPPTEAVGDQVELTLVIDASRFDEVSLRVDELVREFDLVTHVRRK